MHTLFDAIKIVSYRYNHYYLHTSKYIPEYYVETSPSSILYKRKMDNSNAHKSRLGLNKLQLIHMV